MSTEHFTIQVILISIYQNEFPPTKTQMPQFTLLTFIKKRQRPTLFQLFIIAEWNCLLYNFFLNIIK